MPPLSASDATPALTPIAASLRYDSRLAEFKQPFGAQPAKTWVEFQISALPGVDKLELVIERRRVEGNEDVVAYAEEARVPLHKTAGAAGRERWKARHRFGGPGVYGYYFVATIGGQRYLVQNNADPIHWTKEKGSMGPATVAAMPAGLDAKDPFAIRRFRQTIFASDFIVPDYARDLVYYYVFPERFRNGDKSNDPQVGQAKYQDHGIERHPRWLDRPYKPGSGDGSDAVYNNDFFGGDLAGLIDKLDDLRELGANALYLTPVFQAASNHKYDTGDYRRVDPAFGTNADFERLTREAARRGIRVIPDTSLNHVGADSPYFNRFGNFPAGGAFDNGKPNPASPYASWFKFDLSKAKPDDQYAAWIGIKDLPELDKSSKAFRDYAFGKEGVMQYWLDRGAAGWRMDVAPWVPDDFWRAWRVAVKKHRPDALTIAETWFDASKFFLGDTFDGTMNYIFRNAVLDYAAGGDAQRAYANLELLRESYPPQALFASMTLLSSHDQPRALFHFGVRDDSPPGKVADGKRRLLLAMFFQMTYPGAPTIYYGDEVGVGGGEDPYNRAPYPWADEGGQPDLALRGQVQRLVALRRSQPVLRHGSLTAPLWLDEHVIVLLRQDGKRNAIVAMNNATEPMRVEIALPAALRGEAFIDAMAPGAPMKAADNGKLIVEIAPLSGRALIGD
ncbi:glycoside hydrolase family 13 protein [Mitsuaria sp. GD03876]|uniref:glycoside hydrolase family 13 protein n=1 Tax=Mitsuaria sp. GD03876 TaxID=2975399 RepID=UPI002446A946|nr:glycoside hydrolase family 13 protein [Mitsuaria sp. GD03876]MDH0867308.1 glycoside hydrolase family 13 protein [Mitsuaria sp. GD03876]